MLGEGGGEGGGRMMGLCQLLLSPRAHHLDAVTRQTLMLPDLLNSGNEWPMTYALVQTR